MASPWPVPGYTLVEPIADPGGRWDSGGAWRARRFSDGAPVVVRVLGGVDDDGLHRLRGDAAALGTLAHPHLVAVRDVVRTEAGEVAVVTDEVSGARLVDLLARSGGLDGGAVVTLLAPLADAVAALHGRGLTHGDIRAETVLVTPAGRPLLEVSLARAETPPSYDDVRALARLGLGALADPHSAPAALVETLRSAAAADPARQPAAAALAADLLRACPATPLPVPVRPSPPPVPQPTAGPTSNQLGRTGALSLRVAVGVAGLAAAIVAGTAWGNAGNAGNASDAGDPAAPLARPAPTPPPTATVSSTPARPAPEWTEVVAELERRRAAAIRAGDVVALRRVYLPGSAARRRDVRLLRDLTARGLRIRGLHPAVTAVTVVRAGRRTVLRVTDTLSAVRVVDADHHVVQRRRHRGAATVRLTLVRRGGGWAIARIGQPTSARSAASTSS